MTPRIEVLDRGGVALALHSWLAREHRATLLYIHGLQSHAGWLFQTGPALAERGVSTYALDRRGSGQSAGRRGDVSSYQVWIDDYVAAIRTIRERHRALPFTIFGQSMGGSLATALSVRQDADFDALVLCTPALNALHTKFSSEQIRAVRADASDTEYPIRLQDDWYTEDPNFLSFMKNDSRMVRTYFARTQAAILDLEDIYMAPEAHLPGLKPTALLLPQRDRILPLDVVRKNFDRLRGKNSLVVEFPSDEHYLEFSRCRSGVWSFAAHFALNGDQFFKE
jgi:alpha-beta hydrolase superfamily lysophospholipase